MQAWHLLQPQTAAHKPAISSDVFALLHLYLRKEFLAVALQSTIHFIFKLQANMILIAITSEQLSQNL